MQNYIWIKIEKRAYTFLEAKIATTKNYILSILSLSIILNLFLFFCKSEPEYSYKKYSYKKKSVYLFRRTIP